MTSRIGIIGAGIAGLSCAQRLKDSGLEVAIFDKGKRPGGRLSSLVLDQWEWDFGAQYLTVRSSEFAAEVARWQDQRMVAPWMNGPDGALVGVPSMASLVGALCRDHDVTFNAQVLGSERGADGWHLFGPGFRAGPFAALVVAVPAEQAAPLVGLHDLDMAREVAAARSHPCWTVMAAFAERLEGLPDYLSDCGAIAWAARNNSKPARAQSECWVIQAGPAWSQAHLEQDRESIARLLLEEFLSETAVGSRSPTFLKAHRWRFATPFGQSGEALWNPALRLGACGDWSIGPMIEGAWLSGVALAEAVLGEAIGTTRRAAG